MRELSLAKAKAPATLGLSAILAQTYGTWQLQ